MRIARIWVFIVIGLFLGSNICIAAPIFTGVEEPKGLHGEAWAAINKSVDHEWGDRPLLPV